MRPFHLGISPGILGVRCKKADCELDRDPPPCINAATVGKPHPFNVELQYRRVGSTLSHCPADHTSGGDLLEFSQGLFQEIHTPRCEVPMSCWQRWS